MSTTLANPRSAALLALAAWGLLAFATPAAAQGEFDRAKQFKQRGEDRATPTPITSKVPTHKPGTPRVDSDLFTSEELRKFFPELEEPKSRKAEEPSWIELKHSGKAFTTFGYDSNVFRAERDRTGDGLFRGQAEVDFLGRLKNGGEIFLEVTGETLQYFERHSANEAFVSTFLEYFQPAFDWLDVGVQNAFEWSRLNLLDDNGDLFPRGRFGSFDEEVRAFVIFTPPGEDQRTLWQWRSLTLETGASFRNKDYEENSGVDSLDYQELRFDGAVSYRISRRPRARVKLKYRFRRRDYREFRARDRDGGIGPGEPHLDLQRHQLNLRYFGDVSIGGFTARLTAGVGGAYNRDLHQNDRSYREISAALSVEWWVLPKATRVDLGVRGLARNFIVRKRQVRDPSGNDVPGSGRLRHRLLRLRLGVWQRLYPFGVSQSKSRLQVALFSDVSITAWRSGDAGEDYDRYVWQAGIEASW